MQELGSIKDQIRQFINEIAQMKGVTVVSEDESLLQNGVIDSLEIFRVVSFLEETFSVRISEEEFVPENFQSINQIERLVFAKSKRSDTRVSGLHEDTGALQEGR